VGGLKDRLTAGGREEAWINAWKLSFSGAIPILILYPIVARPR
jgi:hypothetical protein